MKKTLYNLIKTGITVVSLTLVLTASAWAGYVQIYQSDKETKSDGTTQRDKILVVVNKGIYSSISASITTYKNDLESEDYYVIVATDEETETETPEQLKDFIKKYYDGTLTSGLTGVVLIGDLPKGTPIYPRKYKKFPDDVFYRDINGDGMTKPDIWLGRIDASKLTKTGKSEKTSLEDYFRRNHNYRIGKADLPSHRGLAYISTGRASFNSLEKAGYDSVTEVLPKDSSTSDFKAKLNDTNGYEWIYLAGTHPGYSGHSGVASSRVTYFYFRKNKDDKGTKLYNTSFYGSDKINPKALFYYLSGVYSGMYTYNDYIAGYCVIGNDYGLAAIVPTGNAAFLAEAFARSNKYFYDKLGRDKNRKNIGEAFLSQSQYLFEQNENSQAVMSSFTTILGDPTLTIDPPIADISEPIIGAINGSEHPVTLSGSGHLNNDTSATITGYAWRSKDDKVSFSDSSSSGPTASLSAGEYTVYFKVKDSYGRWSSEAEKTFTIGSNNTEGPSGTININSDAAYTASTAVTLTLTATHDTGVTGYYVSNSATAPLATDSGWTIVTSTTSYSGSVSHTLSTGDGSKTVYAWYKTAASNVSSAASATITLDTAVPTVTITSPTSDATSSTDKKKLSIGGSASDSTSGIKSVAWSNNKGGGETASGTTSWSAEKTNALSDGDNIITVTATDQAGNTATDTITITYSSATDAGSPSGYVTIKKSGGQTIDSVNGKKYIKSTAVKLSLSASDDKAVKGYYISTSSTEPTALASGWTSISSVSASYSESIDYTLSTGDGEKTIYVWYKDSANKVSTAASDLVTLDAIAPTVSITSPTSDSTYTSISSTISLSGSASDATSGIKSVSWSNSLGGSGTASGTTSWSVSGISLQSGDNVITVTATDYAGKTATDTLTVTYSSSTDTTAPKGSITINSGKMYADSGNVTLNLSATDDKGVTAYYASEDSDTPLSGADGWVAVSSTTSYSANISYTLSAGDGNKYVYAWYKDAARNISDRANTMIILDSTAPTVSISGPTTSTSSPVTLKGSASDVTSGVSSVGWNNTTTGGSGTATYNNSDGSWSASISLNSGSNSITITAADGAGLTNTATSTVSYSGSTKPSGSITINGSADYADSTTVSVSISASDDTGVTGYYLSTSFNTPDTSTLAGWTSVNSTTSYAGSTTTSAGGTGNRTLYCWFKDSEGNMSGAAATDTIYVDIQNPSISITSPTSADTHNATTASILLEGSASDSESAIKSVTWKNDATGNSGTASSTTNWSISGLALSSSQDNVITIRAKDMAGNAMTDTITIKYNPSTGLSGSITINSGAIHTTSNQVTLNLKATDDEDVYAYQVSPNNSKASSWVISTTIDAAKKSYAEDVSYSLQSGDGTKTMYVWYKDMNQNEAGPYSAEIILDTVAPTVSITSPTSDSTYTSISSTISLSGSASDATSGVKSVSWSSSEGGSGTASGTTSWVVSGISLQSGDNVITVTATDYAGKTATDTLTVTYNSSTDTTAPKGSITINSGTKMYADSGNVTLNLSATDDKGVTAYYASEDSDTPLLGASGWVAVSSTTSYSANISYTLSTGDGNKYVYAWYKDAARNISDRANTMIILDSTLSAIATSKGFNSSDSQSSKDSVSANSASDSRAVTYSSDTSAPSGGLTINTSSPTKNKTISVGLSATDNVGVTGYYLYDCKATEIISAPKASESGWVELNFTIPVIGYVFGSMDYKLVSDGNNEKTVYVWYKDAAGNVSNKSTRKITLDTTAPTITITSPTSDAKYKSSSSTISLSGSAAGDTKAVTWSNDKGESGTASGITSWLITGISLLDGTNTITVTATDTAGNSASDTLAVTYSSDTSAPSGGLTIHTSSPTKNRTISVSLSATDSVGVAGYYLYDYKATEADRVAKPKATDGGWTDLTTVATAYGQGIFKYKLVSPGNNKKTVFVWFKDAAGNVSGKSTGEIKLDK